MEEGHSRPRSWNPASGGEIIARLGLLKLAQLQCPWCLGLFFFHCGPKPREVPNHPMGYIVRSKQYSHVHGMLNRCPCASLKRLNCAKVPLRVCCEAWRDPWSQVMGSPTEWEQFHRIWTSDTVTPGPCWDKTKPRTPCSHSSDQTSLPPDQYEPYRPWHLKLHFIALPPM